MVIQSFFDDSGNAPDQHMLVIGGLISPAERWIEFTTAWEAARLKLPGADFVKYTEIVRGEGQFSVDRGWTNDLRRARLSEFADIIKSNCLGYVYSAISHLDFQKYVRSVPASYRSLLVDSPYPSVALKVMGPVLGTLIKNRLTDPCDFYFDTCPGSDALIQELWPAIQTLPDEIPIEDLIPGSLKPAIGSVRFENETDFVPLQGADIIAGMIRDVLMTQQTHKSLKVLEDMPWDGNFMDEADVRRTGQMLQEKMAQLVERFPGARLIGYNPKTAARTRKFLKKQSKKRKRD